MAFPFSSFSYLERSSAQIKRSENRNVNADIPSASNLFPLISLRNQREENERDLRENNASSTSRSIKERNTMDRVIISWAPQKLNGKQRLAQEEKVETRYSSRLSVVKRLLLRLLDLGIQKVNGKQTLGPETFISAQTSIICFPFISVTDGQSRDINKPSVGREHRKSVN